MANKDIDRKRCFIKRIHDILESSLKSLDDLKVIKAKLNR